MNFQEFADLVSRNKIPSVLFFEGSEERLKQDALKCCGKSCCRRGWRI